jgi:hypothetical protein
MDDENFCMQTYSIVVRGEDIGYMRIHSYRWHAADVGVKYLYHLLYI